MEGPFDPQLRRDTGATEPVAQDGDLHALLERLLGQGDVRPAAPGAADDLSPDFAAARRRRRRLDHHARRPTRRPPSPSSRPKSRSRSPTRPSSRRRRRAGPPPGAAGRRWPPTPRDSTNLDDIHAAILASVSVELEPIAPAARRAGRVPRAGHRGPIAPESSAHEAIVHELIAPETAAYEPALHEFLPERVMDLGTPRSRPPAQRRRRRCRRSSSPPSPRRSTSTRSRSPSS